MAVCLPSLPAGGATRRNGCERRDHFICCNVSVRCGGRHSRYTHCLYAQ